MLYLARRKEKEPVLLRDVSDALRIPHHFLNKVLQNLTRDGLILSRKGAKGGFELGRPADTIALHDIITSVDGDSIFTQCVLGFPSCSEASPCPVHNQWKSAKQVITKMVDEKTLAVLGKDLDCKINFQKPQRKPSVSKQGKKQ